MKQITLKHSRLVIVLAVVLLAGCTATPEKRAAEEQRIVLQREADQHRRETEERRRSEQRKADELRRAADEQRRAIEREANNRRHEVEQRRNAEEDLRRKFDRYSTGDLKLMDARYKELLTNSSGRDLNVTVNRGALAPEAKSDAKNVDRIVEIERELLRRWKAGDTEAHLPEFESLLGDKK
jgi:TolA-binding protein